MLLFDFRSEWCIYLRSRCRRRNRCCCCHSQLRNSSCRRCCCRSLIIIMRYGSQCYGQLIGWRVLQACILWCYAFKFVIGALRMPPASSASIPARCWLPLIFFGTFPLTLPLSICSFKSCQTPSVFSTVLHYIGANQLASLSFLGI